MSLSLSGAKGRAQGFDYEDLLENKANSKKKGVAAKVEQSQPSILGEQKTTSKADITIYDRTISVKNPGKSTSSIQMFVTPGANILKGCSCGDPVVEEAIQMFFGVPDEKEFYRLLAHHGILTSTLSQKDELRRHRLKFPNLPQSHQDALLLFLNNNKRDLVEFTLRKGWASDSYTYADYMLWSDSSVGGKSSLNHMCLFHMNDVINEICKHNWKPRQSGTVFELGPLTLQMKGSGGITKSAYHHFQFNTSLNDLRKHGIPHQNGNFQSMLKHLEAL
jgi:hypothetical protein